MTTTGILLLIFLPGLCFSALTENLALNAKAEQSSTYKTAERAANAVDGNRDANYNHFSCTHTFPEINPWWRVDLNKAYNVTMVTITNRGDCCEQRIDGAQIRIGNSLKNNGNDNTLARTVSYIHSGDTKTYKFRPIEGRYVNIFLPGKKQILTLCEVEVFADDEITPGSFDSNKNLALDAKAVQSSTSDSLGRAENAVDGNQDATYKDSSCSLTLTEKDPWWRVDLNKAYNVTMVTITNRGDCCWERIDGAQIRIGNSLKNNGNDNTLARTVSYIRSGATKTYKFRPIEGRYVNIFLPGKEKTLTLCEVEVFADEITSWSFDSHENLALDAKAVQSSTFDSLGRAENAVDGNQDATYKHSSCSQTLTETNPWWRVELPDTRNVTSVTIQNRGDCCAERISRAQIRIGNSLENNGNNNQLAAIVKYIPQGGTKTYKFRPIAGKFVNIFLPGREKILTLCEVEVFADQTVTSESIYTHDKSKLRNLALRGRATQSSLHKEASGFGLAQNAIDGNRNAILEKGSCSQTAQEHFPWWRVDLLYNSAVSSVDLTSRADCCWEHLIGAEIRIGNSLVNNGKENPICATVSSITAGETKSFFCSGLMEGRYVTVTLPKEGTLSLCKVEVFGFDLKLF